MTAEPTGFPPHASAHPGIDALGAGCRIGPSVTVFRPLNPHAEARILLGNEVVLFDHVRLLLGETPAALELHDRVIVNVGCYLSGEGGLLVEEDVLLGAHVRLLSAGHAIHGHDPVVARNPITYGPIRIGRGAWIAAGATVLEGLTIGEGAVVGAGSVVTQDIPPFAVAVGNPARVVRYREGHGARPWWRRLLEPRA